MRSVFVSLVVLLALVGCDRDEPRFHPRSGSEHAEDPRGGGADQAAPPAPGAQPAPSDVAAPPANATRTASGLASRVLTPGTGTAHPGATDRVTVHYTGWTTDGQMFDSSHTRGAPATFGVNQLIPGWTEGLQRMTVGEVTRFWIRQAIAYNGAMGSPAGMLVFDVELISIEGR
jgi:peptidylprolyl isomerase